MKNKIIFVSILFTFFAGASLFAQSHVSTQAHDSAVTGLAVLENSESEQNTVFSVGQDGFIIKWTEDSLGEHYQVTDLAITARFGYNKAIVLVTHLSNGKPAINAEISTYFVNDYNDEKVFNESKQGESTFTDENGFAVIDLKEFDLFFKK